MGSIATGLITIILFFLVYQLIYYVGARHTNKQLHREVEELEKKATAKKVAQLKLYSETVETNLLTFYTNLYTEWRKPNQATVVTLLRFRAQSDLNHAQVTLPDEWMLWSDSCLCWANCNTLYLLMDKDRAIEQAKQRPAHYGNMDMIATQVPHKAIPFENIHYYKVCGELFQYTETLHTGGMSYSGASVNGIGFGEVSYTPPVTAQKKNDKRYIVLYYQEENQAELQTLYFPYDALDTLIRVIPQFEKP